MTKQSIATIKVQESFYAENPNEYLAALVTHCSDAIYGKTLDGTITSWNPAAEKLYGYSAKEILGRPIETIIPKEKRAELANIFAHLRKGIPITHLETVRVRKDGSRVDVSVTVSPIKNHEGKIIGASAIARDISEQRLHAIDEKFMAEASTLLASSLDYSKTLDSLVQLAVPDLADWCAIDMFNERNQLELVGVAHVDPKKVIWAKKLRAQNPVDLTAPRGLPQVLRTGESELYPYISDELIEQSAKSPKELRLLRKLHFKSVMIVPISIRGKVVGGITFVSTNERNLYNERRLTVAQDLARRASQAIENALLVKQIQEELIERQKVEEALRTSELRFRKLLDSNILGVIVATTDGRIVEANSFFLQMLGYSQSELETTGIRWDMITPQRWLGEDARVIEELHAYGVAGPWEKEYLHKDGHSIPVLLGCTMLDEKVGSVLTFVLDISERKELERRKDDFISIASHELKTPVTSMKVFTQLLAKRFEKQEDGSTASIIKKMDTQLNKLIVLISDLLDVSRINAGKLELRTGEFRLSELVEETIESLEQTTKHTFVFNNLSHVSITGDRDRIGQVVTNLLTNAIKYSPDDQKIIVTVEQKDESIQFSVQDFGLGISSEEQPRIFERFYQASSSKSSTFPGLGMGLYISSEIIRRHDGSIWVESRVGEGSHFFFTIPLHNSFEDA